MTTDTAALEAALQSIDGTEIAQLGATMGSIPSPTGREQAMGDFLCQWLADQGFQPERHEVADGRCNVVARLKGTGGGKSLIFNSHMDTILYGEEDVWLVPREEYHYNHGWVEDGKAFGEGVVNDKGPMAAFMLGTRALRDAGVKLRGDVIMTMVVGEIGMAPSMSTKAAATWARASERNSSSTTACGATTASTPRPPASASHGPTAEQRITR